MKVAIYCRVIDNFGDAGVCWRLARQLASEHRCQVSLWIDHPPALLRLLAPQPTPVDLVGQPAQFDGVTVHQWPHDSLHSPGACPRAASPASADELVVAAFGCELPADVRHRMAVDQPDGTRPPVWVNLEYLSAEDWITSVNGQPSVKPADNAVEYFLCPGFTAGSAGLLRERDLRHRRTAFRDSRQAAAWLTSLAVPELPGARRVSLFCYDSPRVDTLLQVMSDDATEIQLLVPQGVATSALARWCGGAPAPGQTRQRGALTLQGLPWLTQHDYDHLLWACDLNLVRGEDSWVRGHWAGVPLLWQPYPQPQSAHLAKLDAWLACLADGHHDQPMQVYSALAHAWSGDGCIADAWPAFAAMAWRRQNDAKWLAQRFTGLSERLFAAPDLASTLVKFARTVSDQLK